MATKAKVKAARAKLDKAIDAIYAAEPNGQTPFNGCFAAASAGVQTAYTAAREAFDAAERDAVSAGKAYRSTFGQLLWYR